MSEELNSPPPDPTIRFRLQTILVVTTILAIASAIAAPYWRQQSGPAQTRLIVYWSVVLLFGAFGGWLNWRQSWQLPAGAGSIACIGWATGRRRWHAVGNPLVMLLSLVGIFAIVGSQSTIIARGRDNLTFGGFPFAPLVMGGAHGFMLGGFVLHFLRRPIYLCDNGVYGAINAPWKFIRHAEWVADRPGVMKLRRLDGDIYLDVPNDVRGEAEAFARGKTRFVDDVVAPPV